MSTERKVWDILMKAAIPLVVILCGAVIKHEIALGRADLRLTYLESAAAANEAKLDKIISLLQDMMQRIVRLETEMSSHPR